MRKVLMNLTLEAGEGWGALEEDNLACTHSRAERERERGREGEGERGKEREGGRE